MPIFQYKAYNPAGKEVAGNLEALGPKDALSRLKKEGLYPKEVNERIEGKGFWIPLTRTIPLKRLALTTRQLATLLGSGATLYDALNLTAREEEDQRLRDILLKVKEKITEGMSLSRALEEYPRVFSEMYRNMVSAGEASGSLDKVLMRLAEYLETRATVYNRIRATLTYPILMTIVGLGVLSFLFIFVIPKITRIFEDSEMALPLITLSLITITQILVNYWPFILLGLALAFWGIGQYLRKSQGKAMKDRVVLKLPWVGKVIKKFHIANLTRTLGSLLDGGIPMLKALDITKGVVSHTVFRVVLEKAVRDVTEGASLSTALKKAGEVPSTVIHMVATGEASGELGSMLSKVAESYEREVETEITSALQLLEPCLILVMGVVVGLIVLAILLPIFQLTNIVIGV